MQPYFQVNRIEMAVGDAIHQMINRPQDYNNGKELEDYSTRMSSFEKEYRLWWSGGGGSKMVMDIGKGLQGKPILNEIQRREFQPQDTPQETLELYLRVLEEKLYDPTLDIYTEGTKMTLTYWPLADVENKAYIQHLHKGRPWRVIKDSEGTHAVIKMREGVIHGPDFYFLKTPSGWKFDYVNVLRALRYTSSGVFVLYDSSMPYCFAYEKCEDYPRRDNDRDLMGEIDDINIAITKNPNDAFLYLELARIYWYDAWMPDKAMEYYRKAADMDPKICSLQLNVIWRMYDINYGLQYSRYAQHAVKAEDQTAAPFWQMKRYWGSKDKKLKELYYYFRSNFARWLADKCN